MPRQRIELDPIDAISILDEEGRLDQALEPSIPPDDLRRLYRTFLLARRFDERMLLLQRQGRIGTYLPARGHEAAVLGSVYPLRPTDWLVPVWREWAAYVWRGWPLDTLILLYAGLSEGTSVPDGIRDLPVCVPMGTHVPHAVGIAYAARARREDSVVLCYFGDGASSEGVCQEAMNFAGVYQAPIVFVCVNNQWAISIPRSRQTRAKTLAHRALAYGFPGVQVDGNDLLAVVMATREAIDRAREGRGPSLIEAVTYRLAPHSTADDPKKYQDPAEVKLWEAREPLPRLRRYLQAKGVVDDALHARFEAEVDAEVRDAVERAEARMKAARPESMFDHVYGDVPAGVRAQREEFVREQEERRASAGGPGDEGRDPAPLAWRCRIFPAAVTSGGRPRARSGGGRRRGAGTRRDASRTAVAVQEVVDPGAGALERAIGRRHVDRQLVEAPPGAGSRLHAHPDARLVDHLAAPEIGAATRAIAEVLGAGLGAHVLQVPEDAVAAGLAAEQRSLHGELEALHGLSDGRPPVGPGREACQSPPQHGVASDRKEPAEAVEHARDPPPPRRLGVRRDREPLRARMGSGPPGRARRGGDRAPGAAARTGRSRPRTRSAALPRAPPSAARAPAPAG